MQLLVVFLLFFSAIRSAFCTCYYKNDTVDGVKLLCRYLDTRYRLNGRPLEEILEKQKVDNKTPSQVDWHELASSVDSFVIEEQMGALIFTENTLRNFTKLKSLAIEHIYGFQPKPTSSLSITPGAFRNSPDLRRLFINRFVVSNETTEMLETEKDRINELSIANSNGTGLLETISMLTNLTSLSFTGVMEFFGGPLASSCDPATFPRSIFQKSAATLRKIEMDNCPVGNLTYEMFRNLRSLESLTWRRSKLMEIEPGAFDDLVNIQKIDFWLNSEFRSNIPDGLFKNTKKLRYLRFGKVLDNLFDKSNFTHVENPGKFRLLLGRVEDYNYDDEN